MEHLLRSIIDIGDDLGTGFTCHRWWWNHWEDTLSWTVYRIFQSIQIESLFANRKSKRNMISNETDVCPPWMVRIQSWSMKSVQFNNCNDKSIKFNLTTARSWFCRRTFGCGWYKGICESMFLLRRGGFDRCKGSHRISSSIYLEFFQNLSVREKSIHQPVILLDYSPFSLKHLVDRRLPMTTFASK